MNFKFGRKYDVNKSTPFNSYYDKLPLVPYMTPYRNYIIVESGTNPNINPQLDMIGIKKYYQKGKYQRPRNY